MNVKVKDHPNLNKRDGYIVNIDDAEYEMARKRRQKMLREFQLEKKKENELDNRLTKIEDTLSKLMEFLRNTDRETR